MYPFDMMHPSERYFLEKQREREQKERKERAARLAKTPTPTTAKLGDGSTVSIGDHVCFKSDFEQCGKLKSIQHNGWLVLESEYGFSGDYIGGNTTHLEHPSRCWA